MSAAPKDNPRVQPARTVKWDTAAAVAFLKRLDPAGWHALWAKHPETGRSEGHIFGPAEQDRMAEWIEARQGQSNLYFTVNEPSPDAPHSKLKKEHIARIRAVYADIDPDPIREDSDGLKAERARIGRQFAAALEGKREAWPTAVVDSGNGIQTFWILKNKVDVTPEVEAKAEAFGRGVAALLGGDPVQNIDRVMRLPGTVNLPDAGKRKKGRVPALATVAAFPDDAARAETLDELSSFIEPIASPVSKLDPKVNLVEPDLAQNAQRALTYVMRAEPAIQGNHGDDWTIKVALNVRDFGVSAETCVRLLLEYWNPRCEPPWEPDELVAKVESAYRSARFPLGNRAAEADFVPTAIVDRRVETGDWTAPADLWGDLGTPPSLPAGVCPAVVERFARDRAERLGVDAGAPAAAVLTVLGGLIPASNFLQIRQHDTHWTVRPILWCALVGAPGSNKSATLTQAVSPAKALERTWGLQDKQAAARAAELAEMRQAGQPPGKAGIAAKSLAKYRQKIVNDTTTEALVSVLEDNRDGVLSVADELSGHFAGMDAYRAGKGGKDRAFFLQAKEGGHFTVNRKGSGRVSVENLAVSIVGGVQPEKLAEWKNDLASDGTLQRFMLVDVHRSGPGSDRAPDGELDHEIDVVAHALATFQEAHRYRFAPEADAVRADVEAFKLSAIDASQDEPPLCQWLDKLPNEFGRLALIMHFIEWASGPLYPIDEGPPPEFVSAETATRAYRFLTEFVFGHVRFFYASASHGERIANDAVWVAGYILARQVESLTDRDLYRAAAKRFSSSGGKRDALGAAMRSLDLAGWVRPEKWREGKPTAWVVNPAVHDGRFAAIAAQEQERRSGVRAAIEAIADTRRAQGGAS